MIGYLVPYCVLCQSVKVVRAFLKGNESASRVCEIACRSCERVTESLEIVAEAMGTPAYKMRISIVDV
jgi:hypothetical protein